MHSLAKAMEIKGIEETPIASIREILVPIHESVNKIQDFYLSEENKISDGERYYKKFGSEISHTRNFISQTYDLERFIESTEVKLSNLPSLILTGRAGMGKSHLFADIVNRRNTNKSTKLAYSRTTASN